MSMKSGWLTPAIRKQLRYFEVLKVVGTPEMNQPFLPRPFSKRIPAVFLAKTIFESIKFSLDYL